MLAAWGRWVHRFRWGVLIVSVLSMGPAVWLMGHGGRLDTGFIPTDTESGRARELMRRELPRTPASFGLIFRSPTLRATDPAFRAEVERIVTPLRSDPRVANVQTAYDAATADPRSIARDGRSVMATVELAGNAADDTSLAMAVYPALRALVRSDTLDVVAVGRVPRDHDFTEAAKQDLRRAEVVVLPLVGLLLILVFGSVLAALLPLAVGVLEVTGGLAGTLTVARFIPVSIFATNVVMMVGFAVAIDYSLFIVSRFRQEVRRSPTPDALARTMATAGRAILFSGVTVAIGLLGMLLLGVGQLGSMGLAGTLVVTLALFYALTFLPALLAVLGTRVDAGRLPFLNPDRSGTGPGLWHRLVTLVMAYPWRVLLPVTVLLLLLGVPFLHIRLSPTDVTTLPATAESRRGEALLRRDYPGVDTAPIVVVVHSTHSEPLTVEHVGQIYDLSRWLAGLPAVTRVDSLVDLDPAISRDQYQQLLALPRAQLPPGVQAAREQTVGDHLVALVVHTALSAESEAARVLVRTIRQTHPAIDGALLVTGESAFHLDFRDTMLRNAPRAIGFIVLATYLALFLLLGSLLLPLKAVLMNGLSISASYGALVWLFQDGHLRAWLHFTAGPIETMTPIMMFCVLFGLSMDYEVLLLSRVREEYERTGDTTQAVAASLEVTGRLITGAAAIMALVFFAFGLADMVVIKAIGLAMGIAVVVDATIVRALLVPATMRLLGSWNWWAPAPMARLYRRFDLGEIRARPPYSGSEVTPRRAEIMSPLEASARKCLDFSPAEVGGNGLRHEQVFSATTAAPVAPSASQGITLDRARRDSAAPRRARDAGDDGQRWGDA